jgi:hypothetical protein
MATPGPPRTGATNSPPESNSGTPMLPMVVPRRLRSASIESSSAWTLKYCGMKLD